MNHQILKGSIAIALISILLICIDADIPLFLYDKLFVSQSKLKSTFHGKRVWITGASSGIGASLAEQLAAQGAILILSARRTDKLEALSQKIKLSHADISITIVPFDMKAETDELESKVDEVIEKSGGIDILVLNAGVFQEGPGINVNHQTIHELMKINYLSPVHIAMELIHRDKWEEKKKGHIVVTSSGYGVMPAPYSAAYAATKHALNGFFHVLRTESTGWNLKINIVCPGPVKTELHKSSKKGSELKNSISMWDNFPSQLSVNRCAQLMMSAMVGPANLFSEVWMAKNIGLITLYLYHYFPEAGNIIASVIAKVISMYHNDVLRLW